VHAWQREFRRTLGVRFVHATDEWYLVAGRTLPSRRSYDGLALQENGLGMVRDFLDEWRQVRRGEVPRLAPLRFESATLATATLFAPTLQAAAAELAADAGIAVDVVPVTNQLLGDSITVAGLLPAADVVAALRARDNLGDIVVLPRIMFDHPDGIALDDWSPMRVAEAIGRPVALADWMGDVVDALTGNNKLLFDPATDALHVPVVREGGWAVEKYL